MTPTHLYFVIYKPFGTLSQFTPEAAGQPTLAMLYDFPTDVYPVGRLDHDSEGLLLLTNDKSLNHRLLHPTQAHEREYWVQVEGAITDEALEQLATGVSVRINGKYHTTSPAVATRIIGAPMLPEREPPVRFRARIPTSWVSIVLHEGKNRQVRRMTAAVGFPSLRWSIITMSSPSQAMVGSIGRF